MTTALQPIIPFGAVQKTNQSSVIVLVINSLSMISYKFKFIGYFLILAGIILTAVYSFHRVDISTPVFAAYSSFLVTKYFTIIKTNIFEELVILSYLAGFLLTSFSKEKTEHEYYAIIRGRSWQIAILLNSAFLILSTAFIFGRGFLMVLILNLCSTFILYNIIFLLKKRNFDRIKE